MDPEDVGRGTDRAPYALLFDEECPMCAALVRRVRRWARPGVLELIPAPSPAARRRFPSIPDREVREALHLVGPGGRIWKGARAVEELVGLLPRWRWLRALFRLPAARRVAARGYGWVARNRYRLFGRAPGENDDS